MKIKVNDLATEYLENNMMQHSVTTCPLFCTPQNIVWVPDSCLLLIEGLFGFSITKAGKVSRAFCILSTLNWEKVIWDSLRKGSLPTSIFGL